MARLNHDRPQLRWMDNLRRELNRAPSDLQERIVAGDWPPFLRPVASSTPALRALAELIEAMDEWFAGAGQIALAEPPPRVAAAFDVFARSRVHHPYDPLFCGRDWLEARKDEPPAGGDFRHALLTLLNVSRPLP
jgi:hypothetical protein